jgi:drug/metabolite transporter (DMT)-like permease
MPRLILSLLALAVLFCLLCGPVSYVALRLWRRGDAGAFRPLRGVWIAQVALACALVFAADGLGLPNPVGWMVAIVLAVGLGGAALFAAWRAVMRVTVRRG